MSFEALNDIDITTASMDELDTLTVDQVLGGNLADIDLNQNLPDGVFIGIIEDYDLKARGANPDEDKKASLNLAVKVKVVHVVTCKDGSIESETLVGRFHFQRYNLLYDFGKAGLAKLILGILGVGFRDKKAVAEVGNNIAGILEELKSSKVPFGFTIANKSRGGYDNCDIVDKEQAFIPAEKAQEMLD